jgi:hypothetical protein
VRQEEPICMLPRRQSNVNAETLPTRLQFGDILMSEPLFPWGSAIR